ncbi:hypothetical protein [uncultured Marinobacter sp.]|uniref:hypothetical protein n=1 Tax=uncultured Marinobacter sp. TaxID=187379 RepID=UPI0025992C71|nr:hypothetical protein [uncultured Marinobacter sp.]
MSMTTETNDQAQDALGMSDDAFAQMDPSAFEAAYDEPELTEEEGALEESDAEDSEAQPEEDDAEDSSYEEENEDVDEGTDEEALDDDEASDTDELDDAEASDEDEDEDASEDQDTEAIDYKAEYERLMAPFKANGKEMQVKSIDEVRTLMQMGANYNKKMAALKPSLKTLKLLEKHDLLGEDRLNYLIDLDKKKPEAIQKLIKDSGLDPLEMDVDSDSDYKPETYTVDDREMALDEVLERIQDTPTYANTIDVISNKWDSKSKQFIANDPTLIETINDHMASGIFEKVSSEVEKERTFGRLSGLSDLEAYNQVGERLHREGAFNTTETPGTADNASEGKTVVKKRVARKPDPKLNQKKRAASSTRQKPAAKAPDFNPLSLPDDEFEKAFDPNLL